MAPLAHLAYEAVQKVPSGLGPSLAELLLQVEALSLAVSAHARFLPSVVIAFVWSTGVTARSLRLRIRRRASPRWRRLRAWSRVDFEPGATRPRACWFGCQGARSSRESRDPLRSE